jgi:uncharacterized protein (DUF1501 family)
MLTRRAFLAGAGGAILSLGLPVPHLWRRVAAAAEPKTDLPVLVVLELTGGNDGLNTVVPFRDDTYQKSRPTLRVEADKVLKLNDDVGLHPALKDLHKLWDAGLVKVVQNVGYPNPSRSHFRSMQIWQAGGPVEAPTSGWLGSAADREPSLGRCYVGPDAVPLAVRGRKESVPAVASLADFDLAADAFAPAPQKAVSDALLDQIEQQIARTNDLAKRLTAARASLPVVEPGSLDERLLTIRALLEHTPATRVYYTALGVFDTHVNQQYTHESLLRRVAGGLLRFHEELKKAKLAERVLVLVFSEFGRRLQENGQRGTDHGTSGPLFLVGQPVRGGLLGSPPDLANLELGDPKFTTDFRDVYSTLLKRWLGVDPKPILGERDETLDLLTTI